MARALIYGILGCAVGFLLGVMAGGLACPLHLGGNLCGMVGVFVFPPVGCLLGGVAGIALGIWTGPSRVSKPTSN